MIASSNLEVYKPEPDAAPAETDEETINAEGLRALVALVGRHAFDKDPGSLRHDVRPADSLQSLVEGMSVATRCGRWVRTVGRAGKATRVCEACDLLYDYDMWVEPFERA